MVVAVIGARSLITQATGVPRLAIARPVEAVSVVRAVARTSIQGTIIPSPPRVALARAVVFTVAMSIAVVGAHTLRTVLTGKAGVAITHTLIAEARVRTLIRA